jgi:hypothetical protein
MYIFHMLLFCMFISHWWIFIVQYNLKDRIVKWTHEPRSTFYHKKYLYIAFILFFICCTIVIWKLQKIFTFPICIQTPKTTNPFTIFYLVNLFYLVLLFLLLLVFYLITWNLVLDNHKVELGTQAFILLCRIARRREGEISLFSVPWDFDITLDSPLWGKLLPRLHTLHLESQRFKSFCWCCKAPSKPMHQMQWKDHTRCSNPALSNSTKV